MACRLHYATAIVRLVSWRRCVAARGVRTLYSDGTFRNELIHPAAEETTGVGEWLDVQLPALDSEEVGGMVVRSANMRRVLKMVQRLGPYKASVLIHGESGTGKELVARALHTLGPVPKG